MTNPLMDGAMNVPEQEIGPVPPTHAGFDSAGIFDNWQATDNPTIDRHVIP